IHQRLLQSAPTAFSPRLEKPLGLRSSGRVNENLERHKNVTGPVQNGLTFLATHPDKQRAEAALSTFRDLVRASTCFDTDPEGYAFSPLIFAPSPNSPGASFFTHEEIQPHLQFMIDQQQDDGGWPINWPPISDGVHSECRGIVTLRNLNILKSYNSLG
ncbi:hypothetical protein, partial [Boseongicola sp. H5]|uniref:hypothetical protein n=1 Tax=Boseongicola sp. H5 TaxID=2763261 RepID=UPI001D0A9D6A